MRRKAAEQQAPTFTAYAAAVNATPDQELPDPKSVPVELPMLVEEAKIACTTGMLLCLDRKQRLVFTLGEIFGVSVDDEKSHEKFIAKHHLPFSLLADVDHKIVEAYGVWVEKSMYGKKYMGTERSTFGIGADGRIAKIFRKVKPEEHVGLLMQAL